MRILFSTTAAEGHFLPLVRLAAAAENAGHDVVFATAGSFAARVRREGFETLSAGMDLAELQRRFAAVHEQLATSGLSRAERRAQGFANRFALIDAPAKLDDLRAAADAWHADAIVHEPADLAAPLVGEQLGVPTILHSFGRPIPGSALRAAATLIAPLWRRAGLTPDPHAGVFRGAYVDVCPPSLRSKAPPDDVSVHRLRPVDRGEGRASDPPLVYMTLGTVFNRAATLRMLLDASAGLDCRVLMTVGETVDPDDLGAIPANADVARYIPQREVLPRASVVVSHGGSGSMLGALAHGCPLVLVPQGADQFDNAVAVTAAGAGVAVMPERQSPSNVRDALQTLLRERSFAQRAASIAGEIAALPGPEHVAATLFGANRDDD